jgi:hypothetical protein
LKILLVIFPEIELINSTKRIIVPVIVKLKLKVYLSELTINPFELTNVNVAKLINLRQVK